MLSLISFDLLHFFRDHDQERFTYFVDIEFIDNSALMYFSNTAVAEGFAANGVVGILDSQWELKPQVPC